MCCKIGHSGSVCGWITITKEYLDICRVLYDDIEFSDTLCGQYIFILLGFWIKVNDFFGLLCQY